MIVVFCSILTHKALSASQWELVCYVYDEVAAFGFSTDGWDLER